MIQTVTKLAFLLVSIGIHIAAFGLLPQNSQGASGDDGEMGVTITFAGASAAAMVTEWNGEPRVSQQTAVFTPPTPSDQTGGASSTTDIRPLVRRPSLQDVTLADTLPFEPLFVDKKPIAVMARVDPFGSVANLDVTPKLEPQSRNSLKQSQGALPELPIMDKQPRLQTPQTSVLASIRPVARQEQESVTLRARGAGGSSVQGPSSSRVTSNGFSADQLRTLEAQWASAITRRIQQAQRRPNARTQDGRVLVTMIISRNGQLEQVRVGRSSGIPALDQAAIAAVRRAAPFPAAPNGLDKPRYPASQWIAFRRR